VPAGVNGGVNVFVSDTSHVVLDINGYFVASRAEEFFAVTPCRVFDSRNFDGPLGGPTLAGEQARHIPVLSSNCGIPASVQAYSLNFTVIPKGPLGYLTTWPTGLSQPLVSTLNSYNGKVTANAAIVPAGNSGSIDVYASDDADVVIDIDGYFAPQGAAPGGLSLYTLKPCRVVDTRNGTGAFAGEFTAPFSNKCGLPNNPQAFVVNATVLPTSSLGYLSLWPDGENQPLASTLNSYDGAVTSNMAIVPTINGSIDAYGSNQTQLILDVFSYFASSRSGGNNTPTLQSISTSSPNPSITIGSSEQLSATGHYSDGSTKNLTGSVTWSSSTPSIATVTSGGLVKGVAQGSATISAVSAGVTGSTTITVGPPNLTAITVTPSNASVIAGLTQQFTATGAYTDGSTQNVTGSVTWSSSNPAAATIAPGGLAKGMANGTTSITATSGSISSKSASLMVNPPAIVSIAVTPTSATIHPTFAQQFDARAKMTDGTTQDITSLSSTTWSSDNTAVATISNIPGTNGRALGMSAGTAHITAISSNGTNGNVTSNVATLAVTNATLVSIDLTPSTPTTISLASFQLFTATGNFSDSTTLDLTETATWSSSVPTVARVAAGQANGVGLGTTNITAAQAGVTSSAVPLTVDLSGLVGLAIQPGSPQIAVGTSQPFRAIATFQNGATLNVTALAQLTWNSSDQNIASIGHTGMAKASNTNSGTANITAALGSFSAWVPLTVTNAKIQSITVTPSGKTIQVNGSLGFTATGTFVDINNNQTTQVLVNGADVTWASSDPTNAPINANSGVAIGVARTTANITATFILNRLVSSPAQLSVCSGALQSIAITPTSYILAPTSTVGYTATGTYTNCGAQPVTNLASWNSSNTSVAMLTGNTAMGIQQGNSTITASLNGVTSNSATLVVEGAPLVSISVSPSSVSIPEQIKTAFQATGTFRDGNMQNLTTFVVWTADPTSVATISNTLGSQGLASSDSTPGTAAITANYGGLSGTASLTDTGATLTSLTITPYNPTIGVRQTQQFTATGTFSDTSTLNLTTQVTWSSSNGSAAVINGSGVATGIAHGTGTISATLNGQQASTLLTVQ
jgi:uncharacterized protein YjdB